MKVKVSEKDKKFMRKFIGLYMDRMDIEYAIHSNEVKPSEKKGLDKIVKEMNGMLKDYSILFGSDFWVLYKIFKETIKEKRGKMFNRSFDYFLEWTFEELLQGGMIDEKTHEKLRDFLSRFDLKVKSAWPIA